jgi:hypothetical protein
MDGTALVDSDIEAGRRLIEALDKSPLRVDAALWLYHPDLEEWRLVIATPMVDDEGLKAAYTAVQSVLRSLEEPSPIMLDRISIESPNDKLIRTLTRVMNTGSGIVNQRFTRCAFNNVFIEDALIYRLTERRSEPQAASR